MVTSLLLNHLLKNAGRELRNLKTVQHEHTRENAEGDRQQMKGSIMRGTRLATYDPRRETRLKVRGVTTHLRKKVAEAAYFDYATVKNSQQGAVVKILVGAGPRGETFARAVHHKGAPIEVLALFLKVLQTRYGNIPTKKRACVKLYTVLAEDWDCQQE